MLARMPFASLARWGRVSLVVALPGLWLSASCTPSEDTEPFIPAREGPSQASGRGTLVSADIACERLRAAAEDAYDRLRCDDLSAGDCPAFLGPAGGNGCYEYADESIAKCEAAYEDARSCQALPCVVTGERNDRLPGCEQSGEGGDGGQGALGGAPNGGSGQGGEAPLLGAGAPGASAAAGAPDGGTGAGP
jgi:hypothetical protein